MQNECFICGGNDFQIADGAFVCNECGIQSQTIREEQINFNDNIMTGNNDDMADKDHEITAGSQLVNMKKLLSWECFNLILLGLTKEMIELGAKPSLKIIVLQLWVRYLQCIEAAFISKKLKKLPKLNASINNIDGQILYGVENLKKKLLHAKIGMAIPGGKRLKKYSNKSKSLNDSSGCSVMTTSQKRNRISRKLRKLENSTRESVNSSVGLSDDVSLLQRSKKSSRVKIKLTKNIKKSLSSMPSKTKDLTIHECSELVKSGKKCWDKLKKKEKKNCLTILKIISIIQLALMINNDDIYLSDILRWIHEGHFHVNRLNLFLPENVEHGINCAFLMHKSTRNGLNLELSMLLNHLEANQLPKMDINKLVIRFCDELQLPSDFTNFVCKLLLVSPPSIKFNQILPDIEVKVIAYILFGAKFFFSLDGYSENLSSDFAKKVNQSNKVNKKLFNWNDYTQYIECRNSIMSEYNYLTHNNVYGNNVRNTQLFINDWNVMKSTLPIIEREQLSKSFRDNAECLLKSLPDIEKKRSYREIPASTKPLTSTLKWIFEYYSMELSTEAKKILENNFTQTDILYLTDKNRINDMSDKSGVPIEIKCGRPLHYNKQQNKDSDTKLQKAYTAQTKVYLTNRPTNKNKQKTKFNNSHEENPNTMFIGKGSNYWIIHINRFFLKTADVNKVDTVLKNDLPYSFRWFMCQCSRILDCPLSVVYLELMSLEQKLLTFVQSNETTCQSECEDMLSNITL